MRIIGLTGTAGAGKDTAAQFILDEVLGVKRQGFADALKLSAARIFFPDIGLDEALEFCNDLKVDGNVSAPYHDIHMDGRVFLQRYGTEAHRNVFGQDFWLNAVLPLAEPKNLGKGTSRSDCLLLVIPDVRFDNEAQRIHECGGEVWQVTRPELESVDSHSSEEPLMGELIDVTIINDGSLDDLREAVLACL